MDTHLNAIVDNPPHAQAKDKAINHDIAEWNVRLGDKEHKRQGRQGKTYPRQQKRLHG